MRRCAYLLGSALRVADGDRLVRNSSTLPVLDCDSNCEADVEADANGL